MSEWLNGFLHWNGGRILSRVGWTHETLTWFGQQVAFTPDGEVCLSMSETESSPPQVSLLSKR